MIKIKSFLQFLVLVALVSSKCTDRPQCFIKGILNFNFPEMNLYPIEATTRSQNQNFIVKGYGDFNNDLFTDFIALDSTTEQILVYVWDRDLNLYQKKFQQSTIDLCVPKTVYLYDVNQDGLLDFTVWGTIEDPQQNIQNCLVPFLRDTKETNQSEYKFKNSTILKMPKTTDPILVTHNFQLNRDSSGFLVFMNSQRTFLSYRNITTPQYQPVPWNTYTEQGEQYASKGFNDPHWNIFMDVTGDCHPDLILFNTDLKFQVWVLDGGKFKLERQTVKILSELKGYSIADINYDGSGDLVAAYENQLLVYINQAKLQPEDQFCCAKCKSFDLDFENFATIPIPENYTIKRQPLHFGDIDIDGYPDLLLILIDSRDKSQTVVVYQNNFASDEKFSPFPGQKYNNVLKKTVAGQKILSASFIDLLQNGNLDIVLVTQKNFIRSTKFFYNNIFIQTSFFIKGYGMISPDANVDKGTQYPGMSFYWINSVNDQLKVTYQSQIIQSSYDSLQMPYTFCGLGRANNYVESFTVGRNGKKHAWSPIIPNSQLGVYTNNGDPQKTWHIKLFAFPVRQFIATIIVTSIVLALFGIVLAYFKCNVYKKKEEPLMMQFIS